MSLESFKIEEGDDLKTRAKFQNLQQIFFKTWQLIS